MEILRLKKSALAFGVATALAVASGSAQAQTSSAADNQQTANTVVSTAVTPAIAAAVSSTIATAASSAVSGISVPGAPVASLSIDDKAAGAVALRPGGGLSGQFFSSRAIAGKSAGSKDPRLGVWLMGVYTGLDNDEAGGKFDGNAFNILAGVDYKPTALKGKAVVGIAVAWEDVDIDTTFNTGTFEGSGFTVAPYFGASFGKILAVDGSIGFSFVDYDTTSNSGATTSTFDADRVFGSVNVTANIVKKRFRISPKVGILGLSEEQDAFTTNTGVANPSTTIHMGRAMGGVEVGYRAGALEPFASARANWDFNRNKPVTLANGVLSSDEEFGGTFAVGVNLRKGNVSGQIKGETNQFKNEVSTYSVSGRIRFQF